MELKGKKLNMTQVFLEDGTVIPVTAVLVIEGSVEDLQDKLVNVIGTSKGAGFTGPMKRHGFHGAQATHGQSDRARAPGASSSGTTLGRVLKGTRRAGRHGNKRVTLKNLKVQEIDPKSKKALIHGPLPGARNSLLKIKVVS